MKKILAFIVILVFAALPAFAQETKTKSVKLAIPGQASADVSAAQCQLDKASWYAIAETYRMQLIKLGWDCKPQGGGVTCTVKEGSE